YPELTDEDLHYEEGKEEDLLHRIEDRIGKTAEEIIEWLREIGLGVY
ncbi:MAG: general stress protein CsbD, partial [Bacteroidetes bacterium]|nr:general stress protein CsbD [Bacteroidota bacterium]